MLSARVIVQLRVVDLVHLAWDALILGTRGSAGRGSTESFARAALVDRLPGYLVTVHLFLVHLCLIYLVHLARYHLRLFDSGVLDCPCVSGVDLSVVSWLLAYLILVQLGISCCVPLRQLPSGTAVDILLIYLDQPAIRTWDPVPSRENLDIPDRQDLVVYLVVVNVAADVLFHLLVDDWLDYLLGHRCEACRQSSSLSKGDQTTLRRA